MLNKIAWVLCFLASIMAVYIDQYVIAAVYNAAMLIMLGLEKHRK